MTCTHKGFQKKAVLCKLQETAPAHARSAFSSLFNLPDEPLGAASDSRTPSPSYPVGPMGFTGRKHLGFLHRVFRLTRTVQPRPTR